MDSMDITSPGEETTSSPLGSGTMVVAATIGNALEFFDFTAYSFFAILLGKLFFPSLSSYMQLLTSVATYGIGYVVRPLGGIVFGIYADKNGRKSALKMMVLLMALGSALIGFAPTYAQAGMFAPLIIVVARIIQGFSAGGEIGASTTVLVEYAPVSRRGLFGSLQFASQGLGVVLGAAFALELTRCLTLLQLQAWGWRVPFLAGVAIAPVAIFFRQRLEAHATVLACESSVAGGAVPAAPQSPLTATLTDHRKSIVLGTLLVIGSTVCASIVTFYMPTYAISVLRLSPSIAMEAALTSGVIVVVMSPMAGLLSDEFGRKHVIAWSRLALAALLYPCFSWLSSSPSEFSLLSSVALLSVFVAMSTAPSITTVSELFPSSVRATGMSIVYSVGVAVFGGFAQASAVWLIHVTGNQMAPAYYTIACVFLSTLALTLMKDRTGESLP